MYTYLLIAILIGAGLYFFIRTKALPLRLFAESVRVVTEKPQDEKSISSFRALMLSTASRVGVGNIAGVASAVALGGAGAVFWMWLIAFLGASTAFVESTLAQVYKRRSAHGHSYGGPAHYIEQALKTPWLGYIFAFSLIATYVGGFNLVASYSVKEAFSTYGFFNEATTPYVIGLILAVLVAGAVFGGIKKLSSVTVVLVPLMAMIYIVLSLVLIVVNITQVPAVFAEIFRSAFDFQAIFGAFAGSAVMQGIKRGLYSNEAGVGSAPNAAATASVSHPVKQGLVQMLSVWIDTAIICTATALAVLSSGIEGSEDLKGVPLVQDAWATVFGSMGPHMVTAALCVFAFTTLIGNYSYAESNLQFILRREPRQWELMLFRGASAVIVFAGAIAEFSLA
ncbi:MAG: amino acid carrier protein, partial [Actinobacteria bacterium]